MIRRAWWLAVALCALLPVGAQAENGLFPLADGPRQRGRGGTVFGIAEDAMSINTNPAGMAFIPGRRLDINLGGFYLPLHASDPIQERGVDGQHVPLVSMPLVPSFGYVFAGPRDVYRWAPNAYRLLFGRSAEVPSEADPADGEVSWATTKLPRQLELMAAGVGARVSDVKIYAYYRTGEASSGPQTTILTYDDLPALPEGAKVIGAGVDVMWRYRARIGDRPAELIFTVDGRKISEPLLGAGDSWQRRAASVILDQHFLPRKVAVSLDAAGHEVEVVDVNLRIGYVINGRYRWIKAKLDGPSRAGSGLEVMEVGGSTDEREVDGMVPRTLYRFAVKESLPAGATLVQVKLRYRYDYKPTKSIANLLRVLMVADGYEVGHTAHSLTGAPRRLAAPPSDIQTPAPRRPDKQRWLTFGFGVFPQGGAGVIFDWKTDLFPDGIENRSILTFVSAVPSIAIRLHKTLSIGASLLINGGQMEVDGLVSAPTSVLQGEALLGISFQDVFETLTPFDQLRGSIDMKPAYTWGLGARFGLMWKPRDDVSVGLAYSPQTMNADFKTKAHVDFTPVFDASGLSLILPALIFLPNGGLNGLASDFDMVVKDFNLPQWAAIGVAWKPLPWLRLSGDVKWINWSATHEALKITLKNGNNPDVNALIGGNSIETDFKLGWRDQYVFAAGVEMYFDRWVVRAGYNYGRSPVKQRFTNPQVPALTEHHINLGLSYRGRSVDVHAAYTLGLANSVEEKDGANEVSADWDFTKVTFGPIHGLFAGISFRF